MPELVSMGFKGCMVLWFFGIVLCCLITNCFMLLLKCCVFVFVLFLLSVTLSCVILAVAVLIAMFRVSVLQKPTT